MLVFDENVLKTEAASGLMKSPGLYQSYFPFGSTMVLLQEQLKYRLSSVQIRQRLVLRKKSFGSTYMRPHVAQRFKYSASR